MRFTGALVVLALLASTASAQTLRFDRRDHRLAWHLSTTTEVSDYWQAGVRISFGVGSISLYAQCNSYDDPLDSISIDQNADGLVEVSVTRRCYEGGWHEGEGDATETTLYCCFDDALMGEYGDIIGDVFLAMDQNQILCSEHFLQMRDGEEPCVMDPEFLRACDFYFGRLDSDDWRARDEGKARLEAMGDEAAIWLWKQDRNAMSLETLMRVDAILAHYPV